MHDFAEDKKGFKGEAEMSSKLIGFFKNRTDLFKASGLKLIEKYYWFFDVLFLKNIDFMIAQILSKGWVGEIY